MSGNMRIFSRTPLVSTMRSMNAPVAAALYNKYKNGKSYHCTWALFARTETPWPWHASLAFRFLHSGSRKPWQPAVIKHVSHNIKERV